MRDAEGRELWADADDEERFGAEVARFAKVAGEEVLAYRARFQTIGDWATTLSEVARHGDFWRMFDAGVACSLAGRPDEGRDWLQRVETVDDERDWAVAAKARAQRLSGLIDNPTEFIEAISEAVERARAALRLKPITRSDLSAQFPAR
jgi:hypothetical protein